MNTMLNIIVIVCSVIGVTIQAARLDVATTELNAIKDGVWLLGWAIFLGVSVITLTIDNKK